MQDEELHRALEALPEAIRRVLRTPGLTVGQMRRLIGAELVKVRPKDEPTIVVAPKRKKVSRIVLKKGINPERDMS